MKTTPLVRLLPILAATAACAAEPPTANQSYTGIHTPASTHLTAATPRWLTLNGEFRVRFESRLGLAFREGNDDSYTLIRTRLNIGVRPTSWMSFFVQGQDSRAPGIRPARANGVFRDPFDLRQAYVRFGREDSPVAVTAGRQLLLYGDQRLIGPLDWTNTSRAFDAVKLELKPASNIKLDLFSASVVANNPARSINISPEGNNLHGLYGAISKIIPKSTIEPYLLWKTAADLDRYTAGVRIFGKSIGPWDYNAAVLRQWGDAAGNNISAWGTYAELGYTLTAPTTPHLYAEFTYGSGDKNPNDGTIGALDDLYPTAHLWYGFNDVVGWRNLTNLRIGAAIKPHRKLSLAVDYHAFWLSSLRDNLYDVAGNVAVTTPAAGANARKIGDEIDVTFTVPLTPVITLGGGVGHMFAGPYLKQNTPGGANTFPFVFLAYKF